MDRQIYMDNSATTPVKKEVLDVMMPYFSTNYGNASSIYKLGRESKSAIDNARLTVSNILGANANEIYFTSGGSESDNWAIKAVALANKNKGNHIITSKIEHHAVLHACEYLEKHGFTVTYLDVDEYGMIDLDQLKREINDKTILITIMFANNEVGTIQPIKEIGKIAKENNIYFHTDAVQAIGNVKIDVKELNIDLLSLSAHKFYGPKGVGALYIRSGVKLDNYIHGGAQERNRRAGTENIPYIVGLSKAMEMAYENLDDHNERLTRLRDKMINDIMNRISHVRLNGHPEKRLPGNVNVSIEYIEGEALLLSLDMVGIAASSGSACTSGSLDPSHVLLAMGLPHEIAHGSLRFSLGDFNDESDVEYVVDNLEEIVTRLRKMSPLYESVKEEK
ncbi:cysteine desulfurase NifS [Clostridiisalibacter paucivorans]|uniref:cysteine desulfurase NifS n=1 Tax=Clostridiisalibacter paucivorans TaxID=408753 RepID=UPI00047BFC3F|nr:cysteine desulfurase NifS [Clostridiisalibacter paucivorans]